MLLYIVRHAWAKDQDSEQFPDDSLRPLTKEGRARFRRVVEKIARRGVAPEVIATSPHVRCRRTAEIFADGFSSQPPVVDLESLGPGGSWSDLLDWTNRQEKERVAWVGHAPDVEQYIAQLIGCKATAVRMPKGSLAAIEFSGNIVMGQGVLRWLTTAKMLGA